VKYAEDKGCRNCRLPVMVKENNNKHNFKYILYRADKKKKTTKQTKLSRED